MGLHEKYYMNQSKETFQTIKRCKYIVFIHEKKLYEVGKIAKSLTDSSNPSA